MYIIVDIGNTQVKSARYFENDTVKYDVFDFGDLFLELKRLLKGYFVKGAILSSVSNLSDNQIIELNKLAEWMYLSKDTEVPFVNCYKTPETLGVDRIALVSAAVSLYPAKDVLIIDAGTCITYDFVSCDAKYYGGAISPGVQMRYKALHYYTAKLPELEPEILVDVIGVDTKSSIHSGVVNGVCKEIEGVIAQYREKTKDLTVVLTGGDSFFLSKQLKSVIFANRNFLLEGLYRILIYNYDDKKSN